MESVGYIKLYRRLLEDDVWCDPIRLRCWLDLLLRADYKGGQTVVINGSKYKTERGQIIVSKQFLAERWQCHYHTVSKILKEFEDGEKIAVSGGKRATIITILNYEKYQANDIEQNVKENLLKNNVLQEKNEEKEQDNIKENIKENVNQNVNNIKNIKNINNNSAVVDTREGFENFPVPTFERAGDNETYKAQLLADRMFWEIAAMQYGVGIEKAKEFLDEFMRDAYMRGKSEHWSFSDFRTHFVNWMGKHIAGMRNEKQKEQNGHNDNKSLRRGNFETEAKSNAEYYCDF